MRRVYQNVLYCSSDEHILHQTTQRRRGGRERWDLLQLVSSEFLCRSLCPADRRVRRIPVRHKPVLSAKQYPAVCVIVEKESRIGHMA